jgi:hypothetical protein
LRSDLLIREPESEGPKPSVRKNRFGSSASHPTARICSKLRDQRIREPDPGQLGQFFLLLASSNPQYIVIHGHFNPSRTLDRAVERQSAALGISKSDLAREALKRYLRVAEFRALRSKMAARAQTGEINTHEEACEALKGK